jgi:hypothetical protein
MASKVYSTIIFDEEDEKEDENDKENNEDIFEKLYYEMRDELKALSAEEAKKKEKEKEKENKKEPKKKDLNDQLKNLKITDRKSSDDLIDFVIIDKVDENNDEEEIENISDKDDF